MSNNGELLARGNSHGSSDATPEDDAEVCDVDSSCTSTLDLFSVGALSSCLLEKFKLGVILQEVLVGVAGL